MTTEEYYKNEAIKFVANLEQNYLQVLKASQAEATDLLSRVFFVLAGDRNKELRVAIHEYLTGKKQTKTNSNASKVSEELNRFLLAKQAKTLLSQYKNDSQGLQGITKNKENQEFHDFLINLSNLPNDDGSEKRLTYNRKTLR
jgi:hypothetical protein